MVYVYLNHQTMEDNLDTVRLENELAGLLKKMDIPDHRKSTKTIHNYRWLLENLGKRNSDKKGFARAMEILEILAKQKK